MCTEPLKKGRHTRVCACANLFLHLHCQQRLLETVSKDGRCTICRCRYTNIRKRPCVMGRIFLLYVATTLVFTGTFLGTMMCINHLFEIDTFTRAPTFVRRDDDVITAWFHLHQQIVLSHIVLVLTHMITLVIVHASSALLMRYYLHCLIQLSESMHLSNWIVYDDDGVGIRRPVIV